MRRGVFAGVAALALGACQGELAPRGELVVFIDTDAPLARAPGEADAPELAPPLFDRLRVEVLDARGGLACTACRRDFAVSARELASGATSFGVLAPPARADLSVRCRLFRGVRLRGEEPPADGTLDRAYALPAIGAEGIAEVTAFLPLDALGAGPSAEPLDPITRGKSFSGALHDGVTPRGCARAPRPGEVCVPGGAYWMSSAVHDVAMTGELPPERVVIVSPFFLDAREVTVAELRASGLARAGDPVLATGAAGSCTYTEQPGANEALPVDCVSWDVAKRYCEAQSKRLPTEAELEYVESGMRAHRYVWGDDAPTCYDAVFARSSVIPADPLSPLTQCAALGSGPARAGTGARDVLRLPTGDIVDLTGNVAEWAQDHFAELTGACWGVGVKVDPMCAGAGAHTYRGGSWRATAFGLNAPAARGAATGVPASPDAADVGFRCARSGS